MKKLIALINELETKIPHSEKINTTVSGGSVGWHIHHSLSRRRLVSDQRHYSTDHCH